MTSCGSSTCEAASDVSLSHTCFTFPPCTCCLVVFVVFVFVLFAFRFCFCKCLDGFLSLILQTLDDQQCFTTRSTTAKKN